MKQNEKNIIKRRFVNFFAVLGYFSCSLQWFWSVILYFGLILSLLELTVDKNAEEVIVKPVSVVDTNSSYMYIIFGVIFAILMLIVSIYVLIKIPSTVARSEKNIIHKTAIKTVPLIIKIQHKKDNQKNRLKLTSKLIFIIKTQLIILPIFITLLSKLLEKPMLNYQLSIYVSLILAGLSIVFFSAQYCLARFFKIKNEFLW